MMDYCYCTCKFPKISYFFYGEVFVFFRNRPMWESVFYKAHLHSPVLRSRIWGSYAPLRSATKRKRAM